MVVSVVRIRDESQNFRSLRTIQYGAMSMGMIAKRRPRNDVQGDNKAYFAALYMQMRENDLKMQYMAFRIWFHGELKCYFTSPFISDGSCSNTCRKTVFWHIVGVLRPRHSGLLKFCPSSKYCLLLLNVLKRSLWSYAAVFVASWLYIEE